MTTAEIAYERMALLSELDRAMNWVNIFYRAQNWDGFSGHATNSAQIGRLLELNANQVPGECS